MTPVLLRPDLAAVAAAVPEGARVLDIGCGDGQLLAWLRDTKGVEGRGIIPMPHSTW
jgi:cyclopropane fatty-acyl-phospholipid synthase-like methyltransferase